MNKIIQKSIQVKKGTSWQNDHSFNWLILFMSSLCRCFCPQQLTNKEHHKECHNVILSGLMRMIMNKDNENYEQSS